MAENEDDLIKPFTEADMDTRAGKLRIIVAWVLFWASALFFAFMVYVAIM
ncbi:MAG: hypothetical protein U9N09_05470 [Euryarchaeota archaeon]|nr:hypothetical protein [Euryarchaeota archaeon]